VGFAHPMPKGKRGGAVFLEGTNSYIAVDSLSNQVWGTALTVSLWFYRSDEFKWYSILAGAGGSSDVSWALYLGHQQEGKSVGCGVSTYLDRNQWGGVKDAQAAIKAWHHVVMTYDGTEVLMYLDDVIHEGDGEDQGPIVDYGKPLYLGGTVKPQVPGSNKPEQFTGMMDEVLIYNRVLSRQEISALFRNEHVVEGVPQTDRPSITSRNPVETESSRHSEPAPIQAETTSVFTPAARVEPPTAAPAFSSRAELDAALASQNEMYCCEKLKELAREWEKGNTQKVMSMLDELTGGY